MSTKSWLQLIWGKKYSHVFVSSCLVRSGKIPKRKVLYTIMSFTWCLTTLKKKETILMYNYIRHYQLLLWCKLNTCSLLKINDTNENNQTSLFTANQTTDVAQISTWLIQWTVSGEIPISHRINISWRMKSGHQLCDFCCSKIKHLYWQDKEKTHKVSVIL